ncbi:NADH-quinone oxidoreductase subunit N [Salsipaludibacter albus]|uniref:NADH-quinone oxidoreductase subunit N n=1 Tax=Salsipaludibacter albus TaxID=2849650 RepID=UPI001EE3AD67|nr:NADH-quinone oxidoreductase subunit N [Salsipaludibacter albus]MBY5161393.1 NADH-quinone oxidoreductase subunit N [Salsipaludibacter albus]
MQLSHLAPQIAVLLGAAATLLVAMFAPRDRQWLNAPVALVAIAVAAGLQVGLLGGVPVLAFDGLWALDAVTNVASLAILAATALVVPLVPRWLAPDARHGEYYPMLLLGALGAMVMAAATDLNELVVGVVLSSVTGYVLAAWHRRSAWSVEAGMKYFLVGGLANLVLLVGVTLAFAAAGSTWYPALASRLDGVDPWLLVPATAMLVVGLAFKAGAVPTHSWVPDVAEGAPAPSAAFVTVVPKIGGLVALARLLAVVPPDSSGWRVVVATVAVLTMTIGNLAALGQDDVRRLLGWSSVSQAGYALVAVAAVGASDRALPALLLFLVVYAVANIAAFAVVTALRGRTSLADYAGVARRQPGLAVALIVAMLSLVGIPPLAGFAGKFAVFTAGIDAGLTWLVVAAVVNTVVSLAYYLRVVAAMVLRPSPHDVHRLGPWSSTAVGVATVLLVVLGLLAGAVLEVASGPLAG